MKAEFEEGHYLKCWIGAVEKLHAYAIKRFD